MFPSHDRGGAVDGDTSYFLVYPNIIAIPADLGYPIADPTLDDIREGAKINQANITQWAFTIASDGCVFDVELQRAISVIQAVQNELDAEQNLKDNEYTQYVQGLQDLIQKAQDANANPPAWLTEPIDVSGYQKELEALATWKAEDNARYNDVNEALSELVAVYQSIFIAAEDICIGGAP